MIGPTKAYGQSFAAGTLQKEGGHPVEVFVSKINYARKAGDFSAARSALSEGFDAYPNNPYVRIEGAAVFMAEERYREAIAEWRRIINDLGEKCPSGVFARLARAYEARGERDKLPRLYERAKGFDRISTALCLCLSKATRENGDKLTSAELADEAMAVAKDSAEKDSATALRIRYLIEDQDVGSAKRVIDNVLTLNPEFHLSSGARTLLAISSYHEEKNIIRDGWQQYWIQRQNFVYMHVCKQLIGMIARSASTVADIGSNRTPLLDIFPAGIKKYSVDPETPYEAEDVESVFADFLQWNPSDSIQFGTCMQVMEHVVDATSFAKRMLEICEVSLISVPHLEPPDSNPGHVHSMIDLDRIVDWFGRAPNYHYVSTELSGEQRIICIFDRNDLNPYSAFNRESMTTMRYRYRWSLKGAGIPGSWEGGSG